MLITAQENKRTENSTTARTNRVPFDLVHPFSAIGCTAQARNFRVFLEIELVIVHDFFAFGNTSIGDDDDFAILLDLHDFGNGVRLDEQNPSDDNTLFLSLVSSYLAWVIDVTSETTAHRRVDNVLLIQPKHVDAAILLLVELLSFIRHFVSYQFADVFNHHGMLFEIASGK